MDSKTWQVTYKKGGKSRYYHKTVKGATLWDVCRKMGLGITKWGTKGRFYSAHTTSDGIGPDHEEIWGCLHNIIGYPLVNAKNPWTPVEAPADL